MVEHARRKHHPGYIPSMGIGPVVLAHEEDSWKCTAKGNNVIYGKDNRIAPGGARQTWTQRWQIR
eukprot:11193329-Lingulodinium_polyedra.AAC.1